MKKIGFIDYYLDEWHANNYPAFIREASNGNLEVCSAYAEIDSPIGGMTSAQWSDKYGIPLRKTQEEVIEENDVLIVLSPDNPEMHEELCKQALASGKLVYVDKTFAPTKAAAERIFANADAHGTKCYSSSALRFAPEIDELQQHEIDALYTEGPGEFEMYIIHQIEPVVKLMGTPAESVLYTGTYEHPAATVRFADGRLWHLSMRNDEKFGFRHTVVDKSNRAFSIDISSDYFAEFIKELIHFLESGEIPVDHAQTLQVIAIREALIEARKTPFEWVRVK